MKPQKKASHMFFTHKRSLIMPSQGKRKDKNAEEPSQKRAKTTSSSYVSVRSRDELEQKNVYFLSSSASKFKKCDVAALKVMFKASSKKNVIPAFDKKPEYPEEYVLPGIDRKMLSKDFNVDNIAELSDKDRDVKTFIDKLHDVVRIGKAVIGTEETATDTLVDNLLRISGLDKYPLKIINRSYCRLFIEGNPFLSAIPEIIVNKRKIAMLITEDRHLKNVIGTNGFGESQIAAEILACGDENSRCMEEYEDQILFAVRVISTYVTFYKAEIPAGYWDELGNGLPRDKSVTILRWPSGNSLESGLDLANPNDRNKVLVALAKIRALFEEGNDLV